MSVGNGIKPQKKWYRTMPVVVISFIMLALAFTALILYSRKANGSNYNQAAYITGISPAGFRVTEATLRAMPDRYEGPCPTQIKFKIKITTVGGSGVVIISIVRSDNVPQPVFALNFNEPGTKDTMLSWSTDVSFMGWHQLEILEPNKIISNQAEYAIICQ